MTVIALFLLLCCLLGGLVALVAGLRGRRVDDHPICHACGFDLFGLPDGVNVCSECGADLTRPRSIRHGRRKKRPFLLASGALATSLAVGVLGAIGWAKISQVQWDQYKPVWILARETNDPAARTAALAELSRRLGAGSLSAEQVSRLAERGLKLQADRTATWVPAWGDFLENARTANLLPDEQWQRYARQAPEVSVRYRDQVRRGDNLPVRIIHKGARVGSNSRFVCRLKGMDPEGDLIKPPRYPQGGSVGFGLSGGGGGSSGSTVELDRKAAATAPLGPREARVRFKVVVAESWEENSSVAEWEEQLAGTWELVDADAPTVEMVEDDTLRPDVEGAVKVRELKRYNPDSDHLSLSLDIATPPVPLALRVILRAADGREWPLSSISVTGSTGYSTGGQAKGLDVEVVDVIFRSDPAVARDTVDLTRAWSGEFTIPGVPLKVPSTQPAQQ